MIALLVVVAGFAIDDGSGDCPSASMVGDALRSLSSEGPPERVELSRKNDQLRVRLIDPSGAQLAERILTGNDCSELAHTAAVLIAAWRTELGAATPKLQLHRPPPRTPPNFDVSAGVLGSFAGSSVAFGAEVAASIGRRAMGRIALFGMDLRNINVGTRANAHARFTRAGIELGPQVRFRPRRFALDLHAEATLALLYLDAVGFPTTQSATAFDFGLGGGARGAFLIHSVGIFLGISIVGWPIAQSVRVTGPAGGLAGVPRFETWLTFGLGYGNY
jgi:hypothetical protein